MTARAGVAPAQRFSKDRPCPICGGHKEMPHGQGRRCYGFLSEDGRYAHCTREEQAGAIHPGPDGAYAHRLHGDCRCGQRHGDPENVTPLRGAGKAPRREAARYPYLDEDGQLRYSVVRYEPKDFRPFLPGATSPGLGKVRRIPYRLPQLIATDPAALVFVVEGEKDADNLAAIGLVATCSQGGAGQRGQWRDPAFVAPLAGRRVAILPDNDPDGEVYAEAARAGLTTVAARVAVVRLPNLPPKGDVSDWLAAGGTAGELVALATAPDTAEAPSGRWVGLADVLNAAPPTWLVDDTLPCGACAVLAGKWGSFKSFIALDLALSVATGREWAGKATRQGPAAYIVAEGYGGFGVRARAWLTHRDCRAEGIPIRFLPAAPNLQDEDQLAQIIAELAAFSPPPALIVVDTLARTNAGADENSAKDMGAYFAACQQLQRVTGATVLVLHHPTKNGDALRGSGAIAGAADTILIVTRQDAERVQVACDKQKDAAEFAPLRLKRRIVELGDGATSVVLEPFEPIHVTGEPANDNERKALAALVGLGRFATFTHWRTASGLPASSFARAVAGLESAGLVKKDGAGKGATYHKITPNPEPDAAPSWE